MFATAIAPAHPVFKDVSEVTLAMEKIAIRCPSGQRNQRSVDIFVTSKQLDAHGFVLDSVGFLESIRRDGPLDLKDIAPAIETKVKRWMGNRLVRQSTTIRTESEVLTFGNEPAHELAATAIVGFRSQLFRAAFIDKDVCGGYDGHFRCDLQVQVSDHAARTLGKDELKETIQKAFPRDVYFKASCEDTASALVHEAKKLLGSDVYTANAVVYNTTGNVRTFWTTSEEVPAFPRRATLRERVMSLTEAQRNMYEKKDGRYIISLGC